MNPRPEGGGYPVCVGRVFFLRRSQVYAMEVETEPTFRAGPERALFKAPIAIGDPAYGQMADVILLPI